MKSAIASIPRRSIEYASFGLLLGLAALHASNARAGVVTAGDTGVFGPIYFVGNSLPGINTLTVDGGSVFSNAGFGAFTQIGVGNLGGVNGAVTVTGVGSRIDTPAVLMNVGLDGNGTLEVLSGGSVTVSSFATNAESNPTPGSTGTSAVRIDGANSKITAGSTFNVGVTGAGQAAPSSTVEVTGGGVVNAQQSVVGSLNGSNGKLVVSGSGSAMNLTTSGLSRAFLTIGREQTGEVDIVGGAKVTIDAAVVGPNSVGLTLGGGAGAILDGGSFTNGKGILAIDGVGSELRIKQGNPFVGVGQQGNGALSVTGGGKLIVEDAGSGAMFVGRIVGGTGVVDVTGAGSVLQAGRRLIIGTDATATLLLPGGTGSVNVANGATISAARTIVGAQGTLTGGGGTIVGELVNHGNVAPGNSPGIMTVLGNVTLDFDGKVSIELGGNSPGLYDQLAVRDDPATTGTLEGNLNLKGLVSVALYGGYDPLAGSFFDVFTAIDIVEFAPTYVLPTLSGARYWTHAVVSLDNGGEALRLTVLPAPGSLALLGAGLPGLFAASRRRRPQVQAS